MQINSLTLPLIWILRQVGKRVKIRGWERILRVLFHPNRQKKIKFQISFFGSTYIGYSNNFVDWNVLFYGSYESYELDLLATLASRINEAIFIDVGANVGQHALYMSFHVKEVHAFEPNPSLWPQINEKILANDTRNILLHGYGLGQFEGKLPLYLGDESGESSLISGANRNHSVNDELVQIISGDQSFKKIGIHKFDLIKLDIEGYEKYAIEGMIDHLNQCRPIMMVELTQIGREQFGCLAEFIKTFPNKYKFYSCEWVSGIIIRKVLLPVDDQSYFHFAGNVFCVPFEKENIFINAVRAL